MCIPAASSPTMGYDDEWIWDACTLISSRRLCDLEDVLTLGGAHVCNRVQTAHGCSGIPDSRSPRIP